MPTRIQDKAHLSVLPETPKEEPFPPHLRPAAQAVWDMMNHPDLNDSEKIDWAGKAMEAATDLTKGDKQRIWIAIFNELAKETPSPPSSTAFGSRPQTSSAPSSPPTTSSNGSPPENSENVPWVKPEDFSWILPEDVPAFIKSTTESMLILLDQELRGLATVMQEIDSDEHALMIEKRMSLLNLIRLECIQMNLDNLPPASGELVVPSSQLTDHHGRPI